MKFIEKSTRVIKGFFGVSNEIKSQDRSFLENVIFPELIKKLPNNSKVLFVGVDYYTSHYHKYFCGHNFYTIDIRRFQSIYARFFYHKTGSLLNLSEVYFGYKFDAIIINGVFGYGVNSESDIVRAFNQATNSLNINGKIIIGWNPKAVNLNTFPVRLNGIKKESLLQNCDDVINLNSCDNQIHQYLFFKSESPKSLIKKNIKIGILIKDNNYSISSDDLKKNLEECGVEVDLISLRSTKKQIKKINLIGRNGLLGKFLHKFVQKSEEILFYIFSGGVNKNTVLCNAKFSFNSKKPKPFFELSECDVIHFENSKYQLLVNKSGYILSGDILKIAPLGVIGLHHGDNRYYRGRPAGFYECLHNKNVTGFVVQRYTEKLDGGEVLERVLIPTKPFYVSNREFVKNKSNVFLLNAIKKQIFGGTVDFCCDNNLGPVYASPSAGEVVFYAQTAILRLIEKISNKINKRHQCWKLAFSKVDWRDAIEENSWVVMDNPTNTFSADPFLWKNNNKIYCFFEEYVGHLGRARISYVELGEDLLVKKSGVALDTGFHMSFPYLFEYDNNLYMLPEQSKSNEISLYVVENFPEKWKYVGAVLQSVDAADSVIFEHEGMWWLMSNIDSSGIGDHNSELHIFYSQNPVTGPWISHTLNPVIKNANYSRNAGIIRENEKIFRASQNPGFNRYGENLRVAEIVKLNSEEYEEKIILHDFSPLKNKINSDYMHHINCVDGITVIDFANINKLH